MTMEQIAAQPAAQPAAKPTVKPAVKPNRRRGLQRFGALVRKEIIQLLRDRRSLAFMLGLPLLQLFLFAYAVNSTVYHIPTAVVDQSQDPKSRALIDALVNSQYFDMTEQLQSANDVIKSIDKGDVKAGVVIPP